MRPTTAPMLNSCAEARLGDRLLLRPVSAPRRIAARGLGSRGEALVAHAVEHAGVAVVPFRPEDLAEGGTLRTDKPDLIVVAGAADAPADDLPAIWRNAGEMGTLVTAVVIVDPGRPGAGTAVDVMRRNADMIVHTSDEDFLPIMLQWLGRQC